MTDPRIPIAIVIAVVVSAASYWLWRREIRRLHNERGYDAADPNLDKEAWQNTKATLRQFNNKGRVGLDVFRGLLFGPIAALLALAFGWAAFSTTFNSVEWWEMVGISAACALMAWFFLRMLRNGWRTFRNRT